MIYVERRHCILSRKASSCVFCNVIGLLQLQNTNICIHTQVFHTYLFCFDQRDDWDKNILIESVERERHDEPCSHTKHTFCYENLQRCSLKPAQKRYVNLYVALNMSPHSEIGKI